MTNGEWDDERRMDRLFSLVVLFKSRRFIQDLSFYSSLVVLFKTRRFMQVSSFYSSLVIPSAARNLVSWEPNMPDSSLRSK
jgi:hypothetical protein